MRTSENLNELLPALAKVKAAMGSVAKSASNPFFKSKYADLNSHLDVVEPLLEEHGLILVQPVNNEEEKNLVESTIYHVASGQYISSTMRLVGESDMQKVGSAVTYARRYTLGSLLSMKAEDDDGEGSIGRKTKSTASKKTASTSKTTSSTTARPSFKRPTTQTTQNVDVGYGDDI